MNVAGYVDPPTDLVAYSWAEPFFCGLMGLVVLAALVWAVLKREWILVALLPAAGVSSLIEPFYDYVGGAWWATNLTNSFSSFDGRIFSPYFFPLGYACWVGLGAYVSYRIFLKRPRRSRMLIGSYFAVAWPTWLAYQAGASVPVLWAAGTVTIAACVAQVYALTGYVAGRSEDAPASVRRDDTISV